MQLVGAFDLGDGSFTHPFLAAVAGVFAHWRGWESFHAGAVGRAGRVVMILGAKGAGKTTAMAWLGGRDWEILADDLAIVADGGRVLAGPRCLDLRPHGRELAGAFGPEVEPVRRGDRFRLPLPDTALDGALAGTLVLEEGDLEVERPGPSARLRTLRDARAISVPAENPEALVDLAELPMVVLRRPLAPGGFEPIERALISLLDG